MKETSVIEEKERLRVVFEIQTPVITDVSFKVLSSKEIKFYIDTFKPFDKAGGYGIQEWIGIIGVVGIRGCYYNVVGLPIQELFQTLKDKFHILPSNL